MLVNQLVFQRKALDNILITASALLELNVFHRYAQVINAPQIVINYIQLEAMQITADAYKTQTVPLEYAQLHQVNASHLA